MDSRTCRTCGFTTYSQVVSACPHCGVKLPLRPPMALGPLIRFILFGLALFTFVSMAGGIAPLINSGAAIVRSLFESTDSTPAPSPLPVPEAATATEAPVTVETAREAATEPTDESPISEAGAPAGAATSLDGVAQPENIDAAREQIRSTDPAKRAAAAQWAGDERELAGLAIVRPSVSDPDVVVRMRSVEAVGRIFQKAENRAAAPEAALDAGNVLMAALRDSDPNVRFVAAMGLGWMREDRAASVLVKHLVGPSPLERIGAAQALGDLKHGEAVPGLSALLADVEVRWHAAYALAQIATAPAHAALEEALAAGNHSAVAGGHRYFLRKRTPAGQAGLLAALQNDGDLTLAKALILEGPPKLSAAATSWAKDRSYRLVKRGASYKWLAPWDPPEPGQ